MFTRASKLRKFQRLNHLAMRREREREREEEREGERQKERAEAKSRLEIDGGYLVE